MNFDRRSVLLGGTAIVALGAVGLLWRPMDATVAAEGEAAMPTTFKVMMSEAEWKAKLSPAAFEVLRHEGTEAPWSSPLLNEHRVGTFSCAGCDLPLYDSKAKYDSGTGWPSFYEPIAKDAVGTLTDTKLGYPRSAVYCSQCGGHLGHVFDDGPQPTGLRYCMDGVALQFHATAA
jgi:peptide-methionine (R)-S-oxide reductase